MSFISVKNLVFTYPGKAAPTLRISNFEIKKGEKLFLFGPSGSGKTTLLELLAGILTATTGQVKILDTDMAQLSSSQRDRFRAEHLGYVFQSFNLIPYLTVRQNIELSTHLSEKRKARLKDQNISEEVSKLLNKLGMQSYEDQSVGELSVGQSQRVAVARALLGMPEIILADEPTSSLDHDHRQKFIEVLFQLAAQQNTTVIFVSHDRSLQPLFDRSVSLLDLQAGTAR